MDVLTKKENFLEEILKNLWKELQAFVSSIQQSPVGENMASC